MGEVASDQAMRLGLRGLRSEVPFPLLRIRNRVKRRIAEFDSFERYGESLESSLMTGFLIAGTSSIEPRAAQ